MESEEDDKADLPRVTMHISGAHGALLRLIGSLDHRSGTGEVEHLIACRARDCGLQADMQRLGIPVPPAGGAS